MREKRNSEEYELLHWRERQFFFRKKYADTPPGFQNDEEQTQEKRWLEEANKEYESRNTFYLIDSYRPSEERFVGRERQLKMMCELLEDGKSPVVLYGIGGIGKTALVREYIRRHAEEFDNVIFLHYQFGMQKLICDDCQLTIANLEYSQDKYGSKSAYFKEKVRVLRKIAQKEKLLLVIDDCNVESDPKMKQIFALPCSILVTSRRNPSAWGNYKGIHIRELETEEEWKAFIRAYQNRDFSKEEEQEIIDYCKKVHGHTLSVMTRLCALELGEIEEKEDFFSKFRLKREEKQVLRELSLFPIQGILYSLYTRISSVSEQAVERLINFLLVKAEKLGTGDLRLSLHPLIAEAARNEFIPTQMNCRKLLHGFYKVAENAWNRSYLENQQLEPYVFALVRAFPKPQAWLVREFGSLITWLWSQGYFEEAEKYCSALVCSGERYYGICHQVTGDIYLRMAAIYYNSMRFEQANEWYQKAFKALEECCPFDKSYFRLRSMVYAKLSRMYRYQGNLKQALTMIESAMEYGMRYCKVTENSEINETEDANNTYHHWMLNKARILFDMGQIKEAGILGRQARDGIQNAIREGKNYSYELNEFNRFIIKVMLAEKKYDQAEALAKSIIEKAVRFRKEKSKETLSCREQLADVYAAEGKREEALQEYERIQAIVETEFPYQQEWLLRIKKKLGRKK